MMTRKHMKRRKKGWKLTNIMQDGDGNEIFPLMAKEISQGHRICMHCRKKMPPGTTCVKFLNNGSLCVKCYVEGFLEVAGLAGLDILKPDVVAEWTADAL